MSALDIVAFMFSHIWGIFTGTMVPGLNVSCATLLVAIFIIKLSITFVRHTFGFGGGGTGYRSGSTRNPKISKERKDDSY